MKTSVGLIVVACVCHAAVVAFPMAEPGRLLRVPRIYNALIRSDAKLQPSRAFPYSTPVYQPVGLGPVPEFDQWQPPAYALGPLENTGPEEQGSKLETATTTPNDDNTKPKLKSENTKMTTPLTFYPRSFGYYQPQPIIPYGYPFGPQPYVFGSPFDFGQQTLFRYPSPSFDGYYGGPYSAGVDQVSDAFHSNMKVEDDAMQIESNKSSSDSVGVRESEFLSDEKEQNEGSPENETEGSDAAETS